jgi:hypothetical protein
MSTLRIGVMAVAVMALAAAGCQTDKSATKSGSSMGVMNTTCPYSGEAVGTSTRDYSGQKVGFCCEGCASKWDKATAQERQDKMNAMSKK